MIGKLTELKELKDIENLSPPKCLLTIPYTFLRLYREMVPSWLVKANG